MLTNAKILAEIHARRARRRALLEKSDFDRA
jgi:hypothetical protein